MWTFPIPAESEVLTTAEIAHGNTPVLFVYRSLDGTEWHFLNDPQSDEEQDALEPFALGQLVEQHPALLALADLPLCWSASRQSPDEDWQTQPNYPTDWDELCEEAKVHHGDVQNMLMDIFHLQDHDAFHYDMADNLFVWKNDGEVVVEADLQVVGSFSYVSQTWLWSWGNEHFPEDSKWLLENVQQFGQDNGFDAMANAKWSGEEEDGWLMSAIVRYLLQGEFVYRVPSESGALFLLLSNMRFAGEGDDLDENLN